VNLPRRLRPRKTPGQTRSRALVEAVLEAGSRILSKSGYEALTMSAVAKRAGVSVGSLYQYFPNKESLVAALVEQRSQAEVAFISERLARFEGARDVESLLLYAVQAALEFRAGAPELQRALLDAIAFIGRHPLLLARGERMVAQLHALLAPHYAELAQQNPALPQLEHVLFVLANAIHSLTHEGLVKRPTSFSDEALAREVTRLVTSYLRHH
jgi:AcrR family transcriptional regulator